MLNDRTNRETNTVILFIVLKYRHRMVNNYSYIQTRNNLTQTKKSEKRRNTYNKPLNKQAGGQMNTQTSNELNK